MNRTRVLLILAAGVLVGAIAGWSRPLPPADTGADADAGQWRLPEPAMLERSTVELFTAASGLPWAGGGGGGEGGSGPGAEAAVEWTLQGVLQPEGAILIQVGSDPLINRVPAGGTLPDGSRLAAVERDAAVVERGSCRIRRELYPRPDQENTIEPAGCDPAAPQDTPQP